MTQPDLSEALRQFLMECVHSFEELEVLLLAWRERDLRLTVDSTAQALNLDRTLVMEALRRLSGLRLLRVGSHAPPEYQYGPPADLNVLVDELAKAYDEQRLAIIMTVGSNAITRVKTSAIKTFAEAFMLRKGPKK